MPLSTRTSTLSLTPKPWYLSKGVIGPLLPLIALVAVHLGWAADNEAATQLATQLWDQWIGVATAFLVLVGNLVGIYGRIVAKQPIGKSTNPPAPLYGSGTTNPVLLLALLLPTLMLLGGCTAAPATPAEQEAFRHAAIESRSFAIKAGEALNEQPHPTRETIDAVVGRLEADAAYDEAVYRWASGTQPLLTNE